MEKRISMTHIARQLLLLATNDLEMNAPKGCDFTTRTCLFTSPTELELNGSLEDLRDKYLKPLLTNPEHYVWMDHQYIKLPRMIDHDSVKVALPVGVEDAAVETYQNITCRVVRMFDIDKCTYIMRVCLLIRIRPTYTV
jgi:hypothetical protein